MKSYRLRERAHDELLQDLLLGRNIVGDEAVARFLNPDFERDSHDPFLLPDMGVAVERLLAARATGERVAVWSDYDCDGVPGGVLLADFLGSMGMPVQHYIPHRHKEGYGLNQGGIDDLASSGVTLIVTIDLGTTEHESITYAKNKNIDVIVTDHHLVSATNELPPAFAVINPKRPDSLYPFDGLCGAGVAWKLVQALLIQLRASGQSLDFAQGKEKWYLDLVGIATLCDMVPLIDENRMLARYGLLVMRRNRRPGLAALLSLLRIKPHALTEDDIGFMIGPRINAASRMDSPQLAAQLLGCVDVAEAGRLARELNALNDERKGLVAATVKEVNKRLALVEHPSPIIVMGNPNWRPGILGLVANSLMQAHGKPVWLWGREGGELIRGSCRSDGTTNIVELMDAAQRSLPGLFDHFGGHMASGGFSLLEEHVHDLPGRLTEAYEALQVTDKSEEVVVVDRELELAELSHAQRQLMQLAPFGMQNHKPLFLLPGITVSHMRTFGKKMDHLELQFERDGALAKGIAFFSTPESFQKVPSQGLRADVVGHVELDWTGRPRLRVVDIL